MGGVIIFDPNDPTTGFSEGDDQAAGAYLDVENDALYITDLTNIIEWEGDAATNMTYTWKSSKLRTKRHVNMGAGLVDAESYVSVVFKVYAEIDGTNTLIASIGVADDEPFRLPGGYLSSTYQIEVISADRIHSVAIGESILDLESES